MSSGPYTQAQILLIKAGEDEQALHAPGNPESIPGFHAQQAVENLLKALLATLSIPFELTHNLGRLLNAIHAAGENLPPTPLLLTQLNDFAVVYRYDLLIPIASPDRNDLIGTVRLIREHVVARIAGLSAAP